jgi:hypothetical protein
VAAQVAAIRLLLRNHQESLPRDTVDAWLEQACDQACRTLESARSALDTGIAPMLAAAEQVEAHGAWPGWAPLQRRTGLLLSDARKIALQSAAIARALKQAP